MTAATKPWRPRSWMFDEDERSTPVGKPIVGLHANDERLVLQVAAADGSVESFAWHAYGDCCSTTLFDSFTGADKLIGSSFMWAKDGDGDPPEEVEGYDYIQHYELVLIADHPQFGEVTGVLAYRNSSNGYYGGSAEPSLHLSIDGLVPLTSDIHRFGPDDV